MHNFTPYTALLGGSLIGLSSLLLLWLNGRLAGISSISANLLFKSFNKNIWRILFLFGLIIGAKLFYTINGNLLLERPDFPHWLLAIAGVLVGFGTALANGCTSGHGVCGLGRISLRSFVATLIFLLTGILTTFIVRHVFGVY